GRRVHAVASAALAPRSLRKSRRESSGSGSAAPRGNSPWPASGGRSTKGGSGAARQYASSRPTVIARLAIRASSLTSAVTRRAVGEPAHVIAGGELTTQYLRRLPRGRVPSHRGHLIDG